MNGIFLMEPLWLLALTGNGVLLGLGIVVLALLGYVVIRKQKNKQQKEDVLRQTGLNKTLGIAAAAAFALIVMSWTTAYQEVKYDRGGDDERGGYVLEVPPTSAEDVPEPKPYDPPPLESNEVKIDDELPEPEPEEEKSKEGTPEGTGKKDAKPTGPVGPPAPKVKIPHRKTPVAVSETEAATWAAEMPLFPAKCISQENTYEQRRICADKAMQAYLAKVTGYPEMAKSAGFEGIVYVRFVVEKDGRITNVEVAKDQTPGGGLKEAALRAVKQMAKNKKNWTPAKTRGNNVRLRMVVPIKFKLTT